MKAEGSTSLPEDKECTSGVGSFGRVAEFMDERFMVNKEDSTSGGQHAHSGAW